MKVFTFLYNPMTEESAFDTISLHKTRKGAEMAMEFHKAEALKKFNEDQEWREKDCNLKDPDMRKAYLESFEFGQFEAWCVGEMEVQE